MNSNLIALPQSSPECVDLYAIFWITLSFSGTKQSLPFKVIMLISISVSISNESSGLFFDLLISKSDFLISWMIPLDRLWVIKQSIRFWRVWPWSVTFLLNGLFFRIKVMKILYLSCFYFWRTHYDIVFALNIPIN